MDFKLSIFRFNPKSDYLPYYKKYSINIHENSKLLDLLELVKQEDIFFDYPKDKNGAILVNNYALCLDISLKDIEKKFGTELILEPLSKKRSIKDLVIDSKDFDDVFSILKDIASNEDKLEYDKYIRYFYTSFALKFDQYHQGTSLFLFADELINKYPEKNDEILKIVADKDHGIWYHFPQTYRIFPQDRDIEEIVDGLKSKIYETFPNLNQNIEKISAKIDKI